MKRRRGPYASQAAQRHSEYVYNGLDRLDCSLGYTRLNVVPCCAKCNTAKMEMTLEEFETHIERMYQRLTARRTWNWLPAADADNLEPTPPKEI